LSEAVFEAMDRILGNEDTSNPPLLGEVNGSQLLAFAPTTLSTSSVLTPDSLTPSPSPNDDISDIGSTFNSGKKNKSKTAAKSETLVNLMLNKLELEDAQREEKELKEAQQYVKDEQRAVNDEKRAERQEKRADDLVNIMKTLVMHLTQQTQE
jgi:hypothetical protein